MAAGGPSYFWLDPKVTKRSSHSECFPRSLPVLYAFFVLRTLQRLNRHSRHTPGPPAMTRPLLFLIPGFCSFPDSRAASDEVRQNNGGPVLLQGKSKFCRSVDLWEQSECAKLLRTWFCLICRAKALCGKEVFLLS